MPGVPNIIHSRAFLSSDPRGNHCRKKKYATVTKRKKGSLKRKRNVRTGRYTPAEFEEVGKNGELPDPAA